MHFAGSNLSTDPKWLKCIYKISKNFRVEKFLVICRLRQRDIVASDSDIAPLRSAVILYSPPKLAKRISLGVSRISLRSNRTRRKANITEKSRLRKQTAFPVMPLQKRSIQAYRTKTIHDFCREGTLIPWR